jgi:formyl-CoA transferase/CoA:oxalate CoA-transferase
VAILDAAFAAEDRHGWARRFRDLDVWWAPVTTVDDLLRDPQAAAAGAFVRMASPGHDHDGSARVPAGPVDFGAAPVTCVGPPPAVGQHTAEVLDGLGIGPAEQRRLADSGVVGL